MSTPAPRCVHCDRPILPRAPRVQYHRSGALAHLRCVSVVSLAAEDSIVSPSS